MARIRTIKPELPQSESMGRVSRDARLCFILLWTLADDEGRLRGNSRMLASLLFPYDDDAKDLIQGWLNELSKEGCIVAYTHESDSYVQIHKWLKHQKIDRPSPSKIPAPLIDSDSPREDSRILPVGPKDQGPKDQGEDKPAKPPAGLSASDLVAMGVDEQVAIDFLLIRKAKRAPLSKTALKGIQKEAEDAGVTLSAALAACAVRGWQTFKAEWYNKPAIGQPQQFLTKTQRIQQNNKKVFDDFLSDSGAIEHDPN